MTEKDMSSLEAEDKGAENEFLVGVQDWQTQILLKQCAQSKGMLAYIPRRKRSRIALQGKEEDFRAVLKEARVLALFLEKRQLEMLGEFLKQHELRVPTEVTTKLAALEMRTAALGVQAPKGSPNLREE